VTDNDEDDYTFSHDGDGFEDPEDRPPIPNVKIPPRHEPIDVELRRDYFKHHWYPYPERMTLVEYYTNKLPLQVELVKLQDWVKETGQRVVIVFEGRDAAGKGGSIRRIMEHLNPRGARVVALDKPSKLERHQWYFQRYIANFPTAGEIVLFDRSWYNRAGVERVMGFSGPDEYRRFMLQCPRLEQMMYEDGIHLIKLWFSVCREEQARRFRLRETDPLKQWKLSPVDQASRDRFDDYTQAKVDMFRGTHTTRCPWTIVKSDCKMRSRVNAMRHILHALAYDRKTPEVAHAPDPWIVASAGDIWNIPERVG
jgi:polyphosphate kinase 2